MTVDINDCLNIKRAGKNLTKLQRQKVGQMERNYSSLVINIKNGVLTMQSITNLKQRKCSVAT